MVTVQDVRRLEEAAAAADVRVSRAQVHYDNLHTLREAANRELDDLRNRSRFLVETIKARDNAAKEARAAMNAAITDKLHTERVLATARAELDAARRAYHGPAGYEARRRVGFYP